MPSYSPDGSHIVYRSAARSRRGRNDLGDSSDDGTPGPYHLRVMPASGDRAGGDVDGDDDEKRDVSRPLTPPLTSADSDVATIGDTHPHWARDFVVFASDRGHPGQMSIWRVNADGSNLTEIFNHGAQSVHPTVFKDGTDRVVFSSTIAEYSAEEIAWPSTFFPRAELYIMSRDGADWERLTHDATNQANAWTGLQPLPPTFAPGGRCSCAFLDSTDPLPASPAPRRRDVSDDQESSTNQAATSTTTTQKRKGKKSACPFSSLFFNSETTIDDRESPENHAALRKHGVTGLMSSPAERRRRAARKQKQQQQLHREE
jgi:hypothetical protein